MSAQKQAMRGLITITTGTNDTLHWIESDGGGPFVLSKVLTLTGPQYPQDIAADIVAQMIAESAASGDTITYSFTIANETGIVSITAAGTAVFAFDLTLIFTQKFLTGGDGIVGSLGANHFGYAVDSSVPTSTSTHTGDKAHSHAWYPTAPDSGPTLKEDDLGLLSSRSVNSMSLGGNVLTYDFGDSTRGERNTEIRALAFEFLTAESRTQFEEEFWLVYAKQGAPDGRFRFFDDRSDPATYVQYHLTGEILTAATFARTVPGISRWSISFAMKRYKA